MSTQRLTTLGLTNPQALAYLLLMETGEVKPTVLAGAQNVTRTNAYKILDSLVELGLAEKIDEHKKYVYRPTNPAALAAMAQDFRAQATQREETAHQLMHELLDRYYEHADKLSIETFYGKTNVFQAYRRQIALQEDLYFIRTNADIPAMGFQNMHEIRVAPSRHGTRRFGLLATAADSPVSNEQHVRSNLTPTYFSRDNYTAPVEWSVTASSLLIISYGHEPQAVLITDPLVALAFRQIWELLNSYLSVDVFNQSRCLSENETTT